MLLVEFARQEILIILRLGSRPPSTEPKTLKPRKVSKSLPKGVGGSQTPFGRLFETFRGFRVLGSVDGGEIPTLRVALASSNGRLFLDF